MFSQRQRLVTDTSSGQWQVQPIPLLIADWNPSGSVVMYRGRLAHERRGPCTVRVTADGAARSVKRRQKVKLELLLRERSPTMCDVIGCLRPLPDSCGSRRGAGRVFPRGVLLRGLLSSVNCLRESVDDERV